MSQGRWADLHRMSGLQAWAPRCPTPFLFVWTESDDWICLKASRIFKMSFAFEPFRWYCKVAMWMSEAGHKRPTICCRQTRQALQMNNDEQTDEYILIKYVARWRAQIKRLKGHCGRRRMSPAVCDTWHVLSSLSMRLEQTLHSIHVDTRKSCITPSGSEALITPAEAATTCETPRRDEVTWQILVANPTRCHSEKRHRSVTLHQWTTTSYNLSNLESLPCASCDALIFWSQFPELWGLGGWCLNKFAFARLWESLLLRSWHREMSLTLMQHKGCVTCYIIWHVPHTDTYTYIYIINK